LQKRSIEFQGVFSALSHRFYITGIEPPPQTLSRDWSDVQIAAILPR
jgi:hypothetical protein